MRLKIACSLVVLAFCGISVQAQLVKCVDSNGKTTYSDTGCQSSGNTAQTVVYSMPAVEYIQTVPQVIYVPQYQQGTTGTATNTTTASTWQQRELAFQARRNVRVAQERVEARQMQQQQASRSTAGSRSAPAATMRAAAPVSRGSARPMH
jgi:hypothetical protein